MASYERKRSATGKSNPEQINDSHPIQIASLKFAFQH
jgi:hypothetical protein